MKIGILTHHYINNFGAFLQAYSLQEAIKKLRPNDEVYIINYINLKHFIINTGGWFRFYRKKENAINWFQKINMPLTFATARKKHLNMTKRCFKTAEVDDLNLDYIIVGSDEVWNYKENKGNSKIKFGEGLSCTRLIAYAPSVGSVTDSNIPAYVVKGIKHFGAVSARDDLTEKMASTIRGEKICRVVDPTFLSDIPIEKVLNIKHPYIMFYYCDGLPENEKKSILNYAKINGYAVYGAGECDKRYTSITVNLTPFQWVWMFKNASFVVTGTFHGVVFSLLYHRQFACYMTNQSRIEKVGSLLEEFNLANRRADGTADDILRILQYKIDYEEFDRISQIKIVNSLKFLSDAISH